MTAPPQRLRVVPLGGLGEIGMNCLALEQRDDILLVDCGTCFPQEDCGVDVIHPDFGWLEQNRDRVRGLVLTHGHEDHIGAVPYLLRTLSVPVWGPHHALKLCERRLVEQELAFDPGLFQPVLPGQRTQVGSFEVQPLRVSHSIVEATALAIRTDAGLVVHTGDFKFDPAPSDGEPTDEATLAALGEEGVALLLSDSTNVDAEESGSEFDVAERLEELITQAKRRVFVALFASNVQRLISLGKIAARAGRRVCTLGRSLDYHVEIARELGYLQWPKGLLLPIERARSYPPGELLLLATGTQAEPGSAMWRLAQGEHRFIDVERGDTVIFSSRVIPGNERPVVGLVCDLLRRGAIVKWGRSAGVHVSGHASRSEQRKMIELLKPRAFVPLHGTLYHLTRHADLARELGVSEVQVVEDGQSVILEQGHLRLGEKVPCGRVHVGLGGDIVSSEVLQQRKELGRGGHVGVQLVCDAKLRLLADPMLTWVAVPLLDDPERRKGLVSAIAQRWSAEDSGGKGALEQAVEQLVSDALERPFGGRPVVSVVVTLLKGNDQR